MAFSRDERSRYAGRPSLKLQKNELRKQYLEKRKAIPQEQKSEYDSAICKRIMATASFRYSTTVLVYSALPSEIDLTELVNASYAMGKRVAFPRCVPDTPFMNFHFVDDVSALTKGSFSIMEPAADAPIWRPSSNDRAICIIPAVIFDAEGHRIGYGKGYYDRYLSGKPIQRIGVIYDQLMVKELPHGKYDLSVDFIVSEKKLITVKK